MLYLNKYISVISSIVIWLLSNIIQLGVYKSFELPLELLENLLIFSTRCDYFAEASTCNDVHKRFYLKYIQKQYCSTWQSTASIILNDVVCFRREQHRGSRLATYTWSPIIPGNLLAARKFFVPYRETDTRECKKRTWRKHDRFLLSASALKSTRLIDATRVYRCNWQMVSWNARFKHT